MEKRLALFCVLSALILGGHLAVQYWLRPTMPEQDAVALGAEGADAKAADASAAEEKAADGKRAGAESAVGPAGQETKDSTAANDKPAGDKPTGEKPAAEEKPADAKPTRRPETPRRIVTLGSLDPASGFRMLVLLDNRGAGVRRIEMTSPQYRDLEDKHGYLGDLALSVEETGGVRVGAAGAGTPAAAAGVVEGDVLLTVDGRAVATEADLQGILAGTKPGQSIELRVRRDDKEHQLAATLGRRPLDVVRPERQVDFESAAGNPASFLLTLESIGSDGKTTNAPRGQGEIAKLPSLEKGTWEVVESTGERVEFRRELAATELEAVGQTGRLEILKRYTLAPAAEADRANDAARAYHLGLEIEIRSFDVPTRQVSYRLQGPNSLPLEGWWYMNKSGTRDVVMRTDGAQLVWKRSPDLWSQATSKPDEPMLPLFSDTEPILNRGVRYIGVDANYFAVLMIPQTADKSAGVFRRASAKAIGDVAAIPKSHKRVVNSSFELASDVTAITPDAPLVHKFDIFAGPKESDVLNAYAQQDETGRGYFSPEELNDYGWFGIVSRPLARILHLFHDLVGNYAIAIIMLTLMVRSAMWPISYKATKNAQKMQELSPELKKIAEKFKDEPEKRMKAQRDLFSQHNYNPFGGCLLALCQLPVFIGLYRCLSIDIELRGAQFFSGLGWCSNLSGPDMFWRWKDYLPAWLGDETGYLGPYFNVLPLVTIALFLVNQKFLTPPATDEQTRMQQQVMKFMTIFIGVMFFKVASGLCIYFVASSCWSLAEHKLLRKGRFAANAGAAAAPVAAVTESKSAKGDRPNRDSRRR